MRTHPQRLNSLEAFQAAYPISLEDWSDSVTYENDLIRVLSKAIRNATDPRKIRYLNDMQAIEQATFYGLKRRYYGQR